MGKLNFGMAVAALLLLALLLSGNEFKPFPNFIFAFVALMFLLQGIESFLQKRKWEGLLLSFVSLISFSVAITSF